jgi:hypothetical protein
LLNQKLEENEIERVTTGLEFEDLERDLARFMSNEVFYTMKRLLPADLKTLYKPQSTEDSDHLLLSPNPFADDFECIFNSTKGGVYVTPNITYGW